MEKIGVYVYVLGEISFINTTVTFFTTKTPPYFLELSWINNLFNLYIKHSTGKDYLGKNIVEREGTKSWEGRHQQDMNLKC